MMRAASTLNRSWGWLAGLLFLLSGCQAAILQETDQQAAEIEPPKVVKNYVDGNGETGIQGRVLLKSTGEPVRGSYVNIYPDTISNLLGPSQFISTPTDADGQYRLKIPPGIYYVVARKRLSSQPTGPLAPGDLYSEHQRIVTEVKPNRFAVVDLTVVPMKAPMFFKNRVVDRETDTGFRGVLIDQSGEPVMGGFAMAYQGSDLKRLPDFASTLSDEQGRFTIYLPEGGTYYLAARIHAWDMPSPGEPYGKYGGEVPVPVTVTTGEFVDGLQIEMAPFDEPYQSGKSRRPF